ncbi:MAG TPA: M43 family zinc metalloprotease [Bacteroidia bacterium]|jgi:hypothetical protein|nr:M43 family zinc metalloprotease [Bacteroidia bacterium]
MKKICSLLLLTLFASTSFLHSQVTTIPVIFHVVWKTAAQNIPDSCLQQQLDVLNEDFNAANSDLWKVPAAWVPIIGNMNVNFVLASTDPSGNPTTGIERYQTATTSWTTNDAVKHVAQGGLDAWPDTSYLNIWVCNLSGGLLGYTQMPGGPSATDGVVMLYNVVGRGSYAQSPYNLGRACTHEVGHWMGLRHMGPDASCADVDGIADTPPFSTTSIYGGFAPFTVITDNCTPNAPGIMWMNFMSYVDDSSMVFFTQEQTDTMMWYLVNMRMMGPSGIHSHDLNAANMNIFPSPSTDGHFNFSRTNAEAELSVYVYDATGKLVAQLPMVKQDERHAEFDLSSLASGIYSVVLTSTDGRETIRVAITK